MHTRGFIIRLAGISSFAIMPQHAEGADFHQSSEPHPGFRKLQTRRAVRWMGLWTVDTSPESTLPQEIWTVHVTKSFRC